MNFCSYIGALVELHLLRYSSYHIYDSDTSKIIAEFNIYWHAVFYTSGRLRAKYVSWVIQI